MNLRKKKGFRMVQMAEMITYSLIYCTMVLMLAGMFCTMVFMLAGIF